jgi:uncharacterized DUF497 family protein
MDDHYEFQGTTFVWDRDKAHRNEVRHEVTFKEAAQAFFDPFLQVVDAGRNDETRDAVVGYDIRG